MSSGSSTDSSRSSRSSSPSESPTAAAQEDVDGFEAFFGGSRPNHKDYESYTTLVRHIDRGNNLVAKRILATRPSERQPSPPVVNGVGEETEEPENAPVRLKKGKQGRSDGFSTAWPLRPSDLEQQPSEAVHVLEDAILAFASAYIRQHNLVHPRQQPGSESTDIIELDDIVPAFLPNLMDKVDSLMHNLSSMRPAESAGRRERMRPMGWENVISAGILSNLDTSVLSTTTRKLRNMLNIEGEGENVLQHRLDMLADLQAEEPGTPSLSDMLSSSRPIQRKKSHRPHLSQQEQEERARKRQLKEAKRLEKAQAKAARTKPAVVAEPGPARPVKRKRTIQTKSTT